ncbi:MAG TPA: tetratricopeptide repeat protein [Gemmatimonadales bacterium]|nr:tetratricopeptide repeat protein [Gemmatimonadales bacterium]
MGISARHAALAAGLVAAAVAAPSIRNGFVADDRWVIAERPLLQHPPSVAAVLREPYWPATFGGALWRPAVLAAYALDYRLGGSPHWFHAVNVCWAGLAAALLTLLACRLSDPTTGLVAGLLFAVHPVHVEAVANVVGRAELMAAAGYATALLCALRAERQRAYLIGVALAAAFAIASKELAATLPAAVLLVYVGRPAGVRAGVRAALLPAAVAVVPIVGYYVLHAWVGAGILSAGGTAAGLERLGLVQRAWAMLPLSLEWWRLLLFPAHLSADYSPGGLVVSTDLTPAHILGALVWAFAGWVAWRWRRTVPGIALGLAWMIITVSPVANIVVPTELLVAERTLYLPSFGIAFALASGGMAVPWPQRRRIAVLIVVLLLGAARSVARVTVWHDDETLFQALKRDAPRSYRTVWMVGKDEFQAGRWGSGEQLLREAIALAPAIAGPRFDLARFYWQAGLWQAAARELQAATAVDSDFGAAWTLLPRALLAAGDTAGAVSAARVALRRFPGEPDVVESATEVLGAARRP